MLAHLFADYFVIRQRICNGAVWPVIGQCRQYTGDINGIKILAHQGGQDDVGLLVLQHLNG